MSEIYEHRGKTIEVDRNTPMGIINQNMRTLENYLDLLERGDTIDLGPAEILQRLMKDVKKEMINTFSFIEDKVGKIRLITASPNNRGIAPGAKFDAILMDPVTYREFESRKIEQAVNEQAVYMAEHAEEARRTLFRIYSNNFGFFGLQIAKIWHQFKKYINIKMLHTLDKSSSSWYIHATDD